MPIALPTSLLLVATSFLVSLTPAPTQAASYPLTTTYAGSSFFDDWTYDGHYDNTTNGDVNFVNKSLATSSPELTYINSDGNAILKVDNTSTVPYNEKRNSVKITSNSFFPIGSVFVLDAVHLPYGCSVWGSFWMKGLDWPASGEIDVFEGVNLQTTNQYALHTKAGCKQSSSPSQTGNTTSSDCDETVNDNTGCAVVEADKASYGEAFATGGGGVFVTELAETGINIWFFPRSKIPTSISSSSSSIDTSSLGTPSASYSSDSCNIEAYFGSQQLIFDITLCGDWAGQSKTLSETCSSSYSSDKTCYLTYVLDSANYATSYFEIKSLKVYGKEGSSTGSLPSKTASSTSSSSSSPSSSSSASSTLSTGGSLSILAVLGSSLAFGFALLSR